MIINSITGGSGSSIDISALTATPGDVLAGKKFIGSGSEEVQNGTYNPFELGMATSTSGGGTYFYTDSSSTDLIFPCEFDDLSLIMAIWSVSSSGYDKEVNMDDMQGIMGTPVIQSLTMYKIDEEYGGTWFYTVAAYDHMWENIVNDWGTSSLSTSGFYPKFGTDGEGMVTISLRNADNNFNLPKQVSNLSCRVYYR